MTGVGGTSLILNSSNAETSETVWNDSSGAGGGGTSAHFDRPSWQTGTGVKTNAKRQVPDIACTADPQFGGVVVLGGPRPPSSAGPAWPARFARRFVPSSTRRAAARARSAFSTPPSIRRSARAVFGTSSAETTPRRSATASTSPTTGYDECTGVGVPLMQALAQHFIGSSVLAGVQYPAPMDEVTPGQNATFGVAVGGASASYQWQRRPVGGSSFSNLSDGGGYSGSTTATLTIANTTTAMSGDQFQCVVQLPSSTVTTAPPSNLAVETPLAVASLAGQTKRAGSTNGTGAAATFNYPSGIALDLSGNLYIADFGNNQIRKVTPAGAVTTAFGSLSRSAGSANGNGNSALFNQPNAIAADSSGNLYVADSGNNSIRKIVGNTVSTLAGAGNNFNAPQGVGVDPNSGDVYVADTGNHTIRKITPDGTVSTFAGGNRR